jgi:hypothetical protein
MNLWNRIESTILHYYLCTRSCSSRDSQPDNISCIHQMNSWCWQPHTRGYSRRTAMWGMTKCPTMEMITMNRKCENRHKLCFEKLNHPPDQEWFGDKGGDKCSTQDENSMMNVKSIKQIGWSLRNSSVRIKRVQEDRWNRNREKSAELEVNPQIRVEVSLLKEFSPDHSLEGIQSMIVRVRGSAKRWMISQLNY